MNSPLENRMNDLELSTMELAGLVGCHYTAVYKWIRASRGDDLGRIFNPPASTMMARLELALELDDGRKMFPKHWPHLAVKK